MKRGLALEMEYTEVSLPSFINTHTRARTYTHTIPYGIGQGRPEVDDIHDLAEVAEKVHTGKPEMDESRATAVLAKCGTSEWNMMSTRNLSRFCRGRSRRR